MFYREFENLKPITNAIFTDSFFDNFLLFKACFNTKISYEIDGHINKGFSNDESLTALDFVKWGEVRPFCCDIIKGRQTPLSFKIILKLSENVHELFLKQNEISMNSESIGGMFLNISYSNKQLLITSGLSLKEFTADKTLEAAWDEYLKNALSKF